MWFVTILRQSHNHHIAVEVGTSTLWQARIQGGGDKWGARLPQKNLIRIIYYIIITYRYWVPIAIVLYAPPPRGIFLDPRLPCGAQFPEWKVGLNYILKLNCWTHTKLHRLNY